MTVMDVIRNYQLFRSFSGDATWTDILADFVVVLVSTTIGMIVYIVTHDGFMRAIELDVDKALAEKNPKYCYTEEDAKERYGPGEGREAGTDVQVCGCMLPKKTAIKFATLCGPKVAEAFVALSFEEKHGLMMGSAKFPEQFMRDSLAEYYVGADGKFCNSCKATPSGDEDYQICSRCKFTVCPPCHAQRRLAICYCKDENFGRPYPTPRRRRFYQKGMW